MNFSNVLNKISFSKDTYWKWLCPFCSNIVDVLYFTCTNEFDFFFIHFWFSSIYQLCWCEQRIIEWIFPTQILITSSVLSQIPFGLRLRTFYIAWWIKWKENFIWFTSALKEFIILRSQFRWICFFSTHWKM